MQRVKDKNVISSAAVKEMFWVLVTLFLLVFMRWVPLQWEYGAIEPDHVNLWFYCSGNRAEGKMIQVTHAEESSESTQQRRVPTSPLRIQQPEVWSQKFRKI